METIIELAKRIATGKRFESYTNEELQIFNGDNEETLKDWNRKDAIEDAINSVLDEED